MAKRTRKQTLREAANAVARVASTHCSVLVVESDPDLQWRLARMLTVQGHRVVGTSTGDGALALMAEWPVDVVLVDEGAPGMPTGLDVAVRLRESHPHIPVVMMTGSEAPELRMAA